MIHFDIYLFIQQKGTLFFPNLEGGGGLLRLSGEARGDRFLPVHELDVGLGSYDFL